jgi:membrane dipeptidase
VYTWGVRFVYACLDNRFRATENSYCRVSADAPAARIPGMSPVVADAHLDLAYNALLGRDVFRPAVEQDPAGREIPTVGLPDLRAANVGLICATIFAMPALADQPGYRNADEAYTVGKAQLAWYGEQASARHFRFVRWRQDVPNTGQSGVPMPLILLLEGADPLRTPDDLPVWFEAGLRIVGLAWKQTRFAGGTDAPGPLTAKGLELIPHLDRFGIIHDLSHLDDQSFWQLLDRTNGPVMASHSNCRAFVPTNRQLSDEMIRAIVKRDGVIGINFYDRFLLPPDEYGKRRANLGDVVRHIDHVCQLAGTANHVAIGTDMDGGLGRNEIPEEIETSADLPKLGEALKGAGCDEHAVVGIMGENWMRFFRRTLPSA